MTTSQSLNHNHKRPWQRATGWLLFLACFFFASYNFANWWASQQAQVGQIVFSWEHHIPFLPWTIVPYWVIDLLYGISLFICTTKTELDSHAKRLLTAQVIAVACFIIFPLTFSFDRPVIDGFFGILFTTLASFDRPFNQAPSLHIALLVILWFVFIKHLPRYLLWAFHVLCVLIAISVLTTYQHHFIDVPTGALLGIFCVWLWPDDGTFTLHPTQTPYQKRRFTLAFYYLLAAITLATLALVIGGLGLWLLWPAISLGFISLFYSVVGAKGFQKTKDGKISLSAKWLLYPYLLGAKMNSRLWTYNNPSYDQITDRVWIGRFPGATQLASPVQFGAVIDMTAEFEAPRYQQQDLEWYSLPSLDLITPSKDALQRAVLLIEKHQTKGSVLVTCALGYSRSALAIMAWLLTTKQATSVASAMARVKQVRPHIVIKPSDQMLLAEFLSE